MITGHRQSSYDASQRHAPKRELVEVYLVMFGSLESMVCLCEFVRKVDEACTLSSVVAVTQSNSKSKKYCRPKPRTSSGLMLNFCKRRSNSLRSKAPFLSLSNLCHRPDNRRCMRMQYDGQQYRWTAKSTKPEKNIKQRTIGDAHQKWSAARLRWSLQLARIVGFALQMGTLRPHPPLRHLL